jgi:FAD/FMN-containing dehydrogenase
LVGAGELVINIKNRVASIVGADNISNEPKRLGAYARDYSVVPARMPGYVVRPQNVEDIQKIIKLANKNKIPVVPCSSGIHFHGNTIPSQGGIVLDLQRMNKILNIDNRNRVAMIEPGVTWGQLQKELEKQEAMALIPLLPHPQKSALTSHLEREPMLIPKFEYSDALLTTEVVLPNGELFRTGSACVPGFPTESIADGVNPEGPGIDWWRLLQGAQGTMGVVTWANVKFEYKPKVNKSFFIPFKSIEGAIEPIYKIQRRMIGQECLLLNSTNLAAILAEKWPEDYKAMKGIFPPWILLLVLAGGPRRSEEKIEYEEEALREIAVGSSVPDLPTSLTGLPGLEREFPELIRKAWPKGKTYWKFGYKGACQDVFFITPLSRVAQFTEAISSVAAKHGYPIADIGFYIQPLERSRACHYECSFYYDPDEPGDVDKTRDLFTGVAKTLLSMGAFFSRPYGPIADMTYERAGNYTMVLKKIKGLLDPNNIMSPGRLCF